MQKPSTRSHRPRITHLPPVSSYTDDHDDDDDDDEDDDNDDADDKAVTVSHDAVTMPVYPAASHDTSTRSNTSLPLPVTGTAVIDDAVTPSGATNTLRQYPCTRSHRPRTIHLPSLDGTASADLDDATASQATLIAPVYPPASHASSTQSNTSLPLPDTGTGIDPVIPGGTTA